MSITRVFYVAGAGRLELWWGRKAGIKPISVIGTGDAMRTLVAIVAIAITLSCASAFAQSYERQRPSEGIQSIRIDSELLGTQIHVTFAADMIPLGGGHDDFPIRLEGPGVCRWGWRGPRTVSCLLGPDERLPLAERYALVVDAGLTTIAGQSVPPYRFEFETAKPTVAYTNIDWENPTSPVIYVFTNVAISPQELERKVRFEPLISTSTSVAVAASVDPDPVQYLGGNLQYVLRPTSETLTGHRFM